MDKRNTAIIVLSILCIIATIGLLHYKKHAKTLNDTLYLANGRVEQLKNENYHLEIDLEKCQREIEETKRQLQVEERWRSDLQQHYWNLKQDYDNYVDEAEGLNNKKKNHTHGKGGF